MIMINDIYASSYDYSYSKSNNSNHDNNSGDNNDLSIMIMAKITVGTTVLICSNSSYRYF